MRVPSLLGSVFAFATLPTFAVAQIPPDFARKAQTGAPPAISATATIAHIDAAGKAVHIIRQGSNGFTCSLLPDGSDAPVCADGAGWQWLVDAFTGQPKPTNTAPGIAYMAAGGSHHELPDGQIVMTAAANTKVVSEPPHWMLLWPVDPTTSGLSAKATAATYVMFAGTPYAHLMIHQDPKTMAP